MTLENIDIRILVKEANVTYKDIAKAIGISPEWLSRLMRYPLSDENKIQIQNAIIYLKSEGAKWL